MGLYDLPLPAATTDAMFSRWLSVIKRRESASIVSLPKFDRIYRVNQFINWLNPKDRSPLTLAPISFQSLVSEVWEEFAGRLEQFRQSDKHLVFLVTDADWLLFAAPHFIPHFSQLVLNPYRETSFIYFFEHDILGQDFRDLFHNEPHFLQNLTYQTLYSHADILHFLRHMEQLYGLALTNRDREVIWGECGGYIWLATEALRFFHEHKRLSFQHPAFKYRLEAIWAGFTHTDQENLVNVVHNKSVKIGDINYFHKTKLLTDTTKPTCEVSVIEQYIKQVSKHNYSLRISNHEIMTGSTAITSVFSPQERKFLAALLSQAGDFLSREELAKSLWGESQVGEYSEWGLDQVVRRVRKRFTQIGFPSDLIHVVRNQGIRIKL